MRGCEQGDAAPVLLPLGAYDIEVCVSERSGRERRLGDNCRGRTKHVFVVRRTWSANLSGQSGAGVLDLGFEKWQSNAMVFTFDPAQQVVAKGVFGYKVSAGSVTYTDQESATGCERFGTLTDFGPTGRLTLFYLQETYEAVGRVREGFRFPINNLCNDDLQGPVAPVFLDTGIGIAPQRLPVRVHAARRVARGALGRSELHLVVQLMGIRRPGPRHVPGAGTRGLGGRPVRRAGAGRGAPRVRRVGAPDRGARRPGGPGPDVRARP